MVIRIFVLIRVRTQSMMIPPGKLAIMARASREYPHTQQRRVYQVMKLTLKNSAICPAVFEILEKLKGQSKGGT